MAGGSGSSSSLSTRSECNPFRVTSSNPMYPIVLVHGIARFDIVAEIIRRTIPSVLDLFERFQYFNGIRPHLIQNGFRDVFAPNLDFAGPSALRAAQLMTA